MNYQLPNGKVVYLSVDEFLAMTDEDLQYLISIDYGDVIVNPFSGSAVDTKKKPEELEPRDFTGFSDEGEEFPTDIDIRNLS